MLYGLLSVRYFSLKASDGEIGLCDDFLFNDHDWSVCHMVALLGTGAQPKSVLIPYRSFGSPDRRNALFKISLTKMQIQLAKPLDENPPVSGQNCPDFAGLCLVRPASQTTGQPCTVQTDARTGHLRSVFEVANYRVHAPDGMLGFVDDILIDERDDEIRYLVLDTSCWLSQKKPMIPPEWITSVNWKEHRIKLNRPRDVIEKQPSYVPDSFSTSLDPN